MGVGRATVELGEAVIHGRSEYRCRQVPTAPGKRPGQSLVAHVVGLGPI